MEDILSAEPYTAGLEVPKASTVDHDSWSRTRLFMPAWIACVSDFNVEGDNVPDMGFSGVHAVIPAQQLTNMIVDVTC